MGKKIIFGLLVIVVAAAVFFADSSNFRPTTQIVLKADVSSQHEIRWALERKS